MRVYLKKIEHDNWLELTDYVHLPMNIIESKDETEGNCRVIFRFPENEQRLIDAELDITEAIRPKLMLKIVFNGGKEFLYLTTSNNSIMQRKGVEGQIEGVYEHIVNGVDYITLLDNKFLPNYTITQPKSKYYSVYRKKAIGTYNTDFKFAQDGVVKKIKEGTYVEGLQQYNDNVINFGYDYIEQEHYVEIKEINTNSFDIDINLNISKTAPSKVTFKRALFGSKQINMNVARGVDEIIDAWSRLDFKQTIIYYNNNVEIDRQEKIINHLFTGGDVDFQQAAAGIYYGIIKSLTTPKTQTFKVNVNKNPLADKVKVYFKIDKIYYEKNFVTENYVDKIFINTNIAGFENDDFVKTNIESITFDVESSPYDTELDEKYTTLYEFVEKAVFDYNMNSRNKVVLSSNLSVPLGVPAKESEWVDYTLKELLDRAFKYVGIAPTLNENNVLGYIEPIRVTRYVDFTDSQDNETQIDDVDFYDTVVSNTKNLISERDFITEKVILHSGDFEYSQITYDNAVFQLSNNIYYVSNAILHTPNFSVNDVKSNMGVDYQWDITKRLFEKDIYNSFPNARQDSLEKRITPIYNKANTIFYESGGNFIGGIGNSAPDILNIWKSTAITAEHALIEMLIVLGVNETMTTNPEPKIDGNKWDLSDMIENSWYLEITYVPYYEELTTKFISNMSDRVGVNWEKKINVNEKVIGYSELYEVLTGEMERKGNITRLFNETYSSVDETIPNFSIVNDNYYITTKSMTINNNNVFTEYIAQKDYLLQNEDVALSVAFERYAVPYEYVNREIMLENHMIFSRGELTKYESDGSHIGIDIVNALFREQDLINNNELYANLKIDNEYYLMRMTRLINEFNLMFAGRFVDNYTAGIRQVEGDVIVSDGRAITPYFTEPVSYTEWNGKVNKVSEIIIGYNIEKNQEPYKLKDFPNGNNVSFGSEYYRINQNHLIRKDAREGIALTFTNYLTTETDDIKFYNYEPITHIYALREDVVLTDNLKLSDMKMQLINTIDGELEIEPTTHDNLYSVSVNTTQNVGDNYDIGAVLISRKYLDEAKTIWENVLVGVIKNPLKVNNGFGIKFYVANTNYGRKGGANFG